MLYAHYGNRVEMLAARLAGVVRDGSVHRTPFEPEFLVVNNAGMARWLMLELARANGIAANVRTLFPAELVWDLLRRVLPGVPDENPYAPERLAWHLFDVFDEIAGERAFRDLDRFLGPGDDLARWSLCRRLAEMFDQYIVYRPDWIAEFEAGGGDWQAGLWRRLVERLGRSHWAALSRAFIDVAAGGRLDEATLPGRISVFGIPSLSPGYLDMLRAAANRVDVHLFWFNPCREYWGDIVTPREAGDDADEAHFERGNALLAMWGRQGRETLDLVQDASPLEDDEFEPASGDTVLARVQNDILELRDPGVDGPAGKIADGDDTIAIHSCHSPMREVEVLHDQLLHRFAADPDLAPGDVLVLTPDIARYAPLVDAVFATAPPDRRIPYSIADRSRGSRHPLCGAFLALMDLPSSRMTPEFVFALVEQPAVAARFDLGADDIAAIRRLVRETGVRWGIDAVHRRRFGIDDSDEHTWRAAFDRLVLGHALGVEAEFAGIAARPDVEGPPARALGRFAAFVARLDECGRRMAAPRDAALWQRELQWMLESFFSDGEDDRPALACIREAVHECLGAAEAALGGRPVDAALVRACVESALERPGGAGGFVDGGVTFCSLVPMRSIPFRLICMLGLNEGDFPRVPPRQSFDRMGRDYRRGDRSRREDDRYLFLELLMSARRGLYLSYVGRDIRDNSERPPSVVVDDLVDYIATTIPGGPAVMRRQSVLERLLTEHPLQAFNEKYFKGCPRYPGYDATLAAAAAVARRASTAPAFFDADLDGESPATVTVADLCAFFANPVRYLLRHRLGLWLDEYDETFDDREPFGVDPGAAEEIRRTRLERFGERVDVDRIERELRQRALLPHGIPGRLLLEWELAGFEPMVPPIRAALEAAPVVDARIDLECGATRVTGVLPRLREDGLFHLHLRKMQARDRVELLVEHLAGSAAGVLPGAPARLMALDGDMELPALDPAAAARWLERFLDAWHEGMRRPLHFFPRAAFEFHDRGGDQGALDHARRTWLGSEYAFGEGQNVYYRRVFGDADPLDERFVELVNTLLGPLADPGELQ